MSNRHHPFLRGRTNKERAHTLLDADMRKRIRKTLPITASQLHREQEYLDRIARWIERLSLAAERAPTFPNAKRREQSVETIRDSARAFGISLIKADRDTRKRMYLFLSGSHGDLLGDFDGDDFTRGRKRYQQFLRGIRLAQLAAIEADRPDGQGPKGSPLVEVIEVLRDIWTHATDTPFSSTEKPRRSKPREADRAYLFVDTVLRIADEVAAKQDRKPWPYGVYGREATIRYAIKEARDSTGLRTDGRSKKSKESDRNTYRVR